MIAITIDLLSFMPRALLTHMRLEQCDVTESHCQLAHTKAAPISVGIQLTMENTSAENLFFSPTKNHRIGRKIRSWATFSIERKFLIRIFLFFNELTMFF